jgi:hypothetical protein
VVGPVADVSDSFWDPLPPLRVAVRALLDAVDTPRTTPGIARYRGKGNAATYIPALLGNHRTDGKSSGLEDALAAAICLFVDVQVCQVRPARAINPALHAGMRICRGISLSPTPNNHRAGQRRWKKRRVHHAVRADAFGP